LPLDIPRSKASAPSRMNVSICSRLSIASFPSGGCRKL
jgi:hypothetical protein